MNKYALLTCIFIMILVVNVISQTNEQKLERFDGKLKKIADEWYLNTGEDFFKLELAPEDFLKDKEIVLESKMDFSCTGILDGEEIIIYNISISDEVIEIREEEGKPLWDTKPDKDIYIVDADKCIGCRLCVKPCPTNAIRMVEGIAVIDMNKCIACGICIEGDGKRYKGCPVDAIFIKK
ncbi:MAG: 4Fe-4S binding protein [Candidatus Cloacimonetes bacterium]|nr:4Fe-4S binding protein [Candidatus Cloacimonadota bacterium]